MLQPAPKDAVALVAFVGLGTLFLLTVADFVLTWRRDLPVGVWVSRWARRYPAFAIVLALVAGGLLGHFFFSTAP